MPVVAEDVSGCIAAMDTLAILLPISRATWLLVITSVTTVAFALSAFACDRLGRTID